MLQKKEFYYNKTLANGSEAIFGFVFKKIFQHFCYVILPGKVIKILKILKCHA